MAVVSSLLFWSNRLRRAVGLLGVGLAALAGGCTNDIAPAPPGTAVVCGAIANPGVGVVIDATSTASGGLRLSIQTPAGEYPAVAFFAALPGTELQAVTYDATVGAAANTMVVEAPTGGTAWTQVSAQNADVGTFSLVLADAGQAVPVDGGTSWPTPQGALNATLVPVGTLVDAGVGIAVSFGAAALGCDAGLF
jgi:hypothetical protein